MVRIEICAVSEIILIIGGREDHDEKNDPG